jgi:hypothetical protein
MPVYRDCNCTVFEKLRQAVREQRMGRLQDLFGDVNDCESMARNGA